MARVIILWLLFVLTNNPSQAQSYLSIKKEEIKKMESDVFFRFKSTECFQKQNNYVIQPIFFLSSSVVVRKENFMDSNYIKSLKIIKWNYKKKRKNTIRGQFLICNTNRTEIFGINSWDQNIIFCNRTYQKDYYEKNDQLLKDIIDNNLVDIFIVEDFQSKDLFAIDKNGSLFVFKYLTTSKLYRFMPLSEFKEVYWDDFYTNYNFWKQFEGK